MDIWSLGCVLSAVATWIVLGSSGIAHFRRVRQAAVSLLLADPSNHNLCTGDYFHNGHDVLPEVTAWHDFLRYSLRRSDPLTGKILDLVDKFMLKGGAEDRLSAANVHQKYTQYLREASSADLEPPGSLWFHHRNLIALAEPEGSEDENVISQRLKPTTRNRGSPRSAPSSPQHRPESRTWYMTELDKITLGPSSQAPEKPSTSAYDGATEMMFDRPRRQSTVRFQNAQDSSSQLYNMSWARKSLRLDEKRFRSPTRSLLRSAAKKVGMKQKSALDSNVMLSSSIASFYKDRSLVSSLAPCFTLFSANTRARSSLLTMEPRCTSTGQRHRRCWRPWWR